MPIALPTPRELIGALRRGLSWVRRGETWRTFFDPFNPRELNPVLARCGVAPLVVDPRLAERSRAGAARFVLALYAGSSRLRRRFPWAFVGESADESYLKWILSEQETLGLSPIAARYVEHLCHADFGSRPARAWEAHADLRAELPFALTPYERGKFLSWLLSDAKAKYGFADEEVLWHLFELVADPACGLERTYRYTPAWQEAVPDALAGGWAQLKTFVASRMGFSSRWLRRALPPIELRQANSAVSASTRGVNLLGYFRYTSGLQQVTHSMLEALTRAGVSTSCRDVPTQYLRDQSQRRRFDGLETFDTTIVNMPIDQRRDAIYARAGLTPRPGVKRIALAWWELEQIPHGFAGWADDFDEIWAPTRFIADALRPTTSRPVRTVLPGLELPPFEPLTKEHFGLDPGAFTFLFVFDFNSRMPRKNPLGLIRAFRKAFRNGERVELAIKVSSGDRAFRDHRLQLLEAADRESVRIIDAVLTRGELLGLTAACDCCVSLHRSEGFGLTIAEAMLLGKPAIATSYSGNLDFMTGDNSRLVEFAKTPIVDDIPPYPRGFIWAEPSVDHAASLMRWMFEHPAEARALGERGQVEVRELLSLDAYGRRLAAALADR